MMELRALEAEFKVRMHKALKLDSIDDYVVVPYNSLFNKSQITVIGRVSGKGFDTNYRVVAHLGGYPLASLTYAWCVRVGKGTRALYFLTCDGSTNGYVSIPLEENELAFFGFVHDNGTSYAYKNGEFVEERDTPVPQTVSQDLYIGASSVPSDFWDGIIPSLYIYDIALSKSEIKYIYRNPFDLPCMEHLVLWLAPGSIDLANGKWWDLSGRNNHGTIYGCSEVLLTEPEVVVV